MAQQTITVDFNANLARFTSSIDKATADLNRFQSNTSRIAGNVKSAFGALGAALSVGAVTAFVKSSIDAADAISKLSIKTGIAVDDLAGWQHVMDLSGVAAERFEMAVGKINTVIVKTPEKLRAVGVVAKDANGALLQLADVFAGIEDPTRRAALAAELFGERAGRDMAVALSQGRGAIEDLIRAGQELNPITAEMAKNAEQFNDSLRTLAKRSDAVAISLAGPLVQSVNQIIERFLAAEKAGRGFGESLYNALFAGGNKLSDRARKINKELEEALKVLAGREASAAASRGQLGPLGQRFVDSRLESARQRVKDLQAELRLINAEAGALLKQAPAKPPKVSDAGLDELFGTSKAKAKVAKEKDKLDVIDPFASQRRDAEADALRKQVDAQNEAFDRLEDMRDYQIAQDEQAAAALGRLRDQYRDMIDPLQKYREQLEEVRTLADAGLIDADQAMEAEFAIQQQIDAVAGLGKEIDKAKDFAEDFGLTFNSALEDALVNGKRFSDVLKSLEQDIARIIIRKSVTEPLGNAVSSILKGIDFGKIFSFGGGKASGGAVYPGQYYVVGEHGPEVLLPNTAGTVVPNSALSGGGVQIVQNISIDSRSDRASILAAMSAAKDAAKAEILASMQRGGTFARATGRA